VAGFDFDAAEDVFEEIRTLVPGYSGISYERLAAKGIQSPCPSKEHSGTMVMFATGGQTELSESSRLPEFKELEFKAEAPAKNSSSLTLLLGRVLHQPSREVNVTRRGEMNYAERDEVVHLNSADADEAGIKRGDRVRVVAGGGSEMITGSAELDMPHQGYIAVTELFATIASAMQDSTLPDPSPSVPGLELRGVNLVKVPVSSGTEVAAD
jgi:predicted molibdopterin-dependent oxidoreductase YjgC